MNRSIAPHSNFATLRLAAAIAIGCALCSPSFARADEGASIALDGLIATIDAGQFKVAEAKIAKALDTALTQHVADCPARNTYKETP